MTFAVLNDDYGPECVCCPTRDVCFDTPMGTAVKITKDIRGRSGCNGESFETWDEVQEIPHD